MRVKRLQEEICTLPFYVDVEGKVASGRRGALNKLRWGAFGRLMSGRGLFVSFMVGSVEVWRVQSHCPFKIADKVVNKFF